MSKNLTTRSEDYSKWYNELVVKADLAENSGLEAVWSSNLTDMLFGEKMQAELE
jgi:prolyl-tRNA synthetase